MCARLAALRGIDTVTIPLTFWLENDVDRDAGAQHALKALRHQRDPDRERTARGARGRSPAGWSAASPSARSDRCRRSEHDDRLGRDRDVAAAVGDRQRDGVGAAVGVAVDDARARRRSCRRRSPSELARGTIRVDGCSRRRTGPRRRCRSGSARRSRARGRRSARMAARTGLSTITPALLNSRWRKYESAADRHRCRAEPAESATQPLSLISEPSSGEPAVERRVDDRGDLRPG